MYCVSSSCINCMKFLYFFEISRKNRPYKQILVEYEDRKYFTTSNFLFRIILHLINIYHSLNLQCVHFTIDMPCKFSSCTSTCANFNKVFFQVIIKCFQVIRLF